MSSPFLRAKRNWSGSYNIAYSQRNDYRILHSIGSSSITIGIVIVIAVDMDVVGVYYGESGEERVGSSG